jgi:hypothetical protein
MISRSAVEPLATVAMLAAVLAMLALVAIGG